MSRVSLPKYDPLTNFSFASSALLDTNGGHFFAYLFIEHICILGPENTHSSDTMKIPRILMKLPLMWIITSVFELVSPLLISLFQLYSAPTLRMSYPKDKSYYVDSFPTAKPVCLHL